MELNQISPTVNYVTHEETPIKIGRRRYVVTLLCLIVQTICLADRTNIGVAIPAIIDNKSERGQILSAFYVGYLLMQIPAGILVTNVGAKKVLIIAVLTWATFDISTIFTAKCLSCLFISRIGVGIGEGMLIPSLHHISAAWYPARERGHLVSIVASGMDLGIVLSLSLSPIILDLLGWKAIFIIFGIFSFTWVIAFSFFGANKPEDDRFVSSEEKEYIISTRTAENSITVITHNEAPNWIILLQSRSAWAIYVAQFCFNYGWDVLLSWVPEYFEQRLNLDMKSHGSLAAVPYICGYFGVITSGKLSDYLLCKGFRTLNIRRIMNTIGLSGAGFFLLCLRYTTEPTVAVLLLSSAFFVGRTSVGGYWVNIIDIGGHHSAHIMAISNTIGTIPGILGNIITGKILSSTNDWDLVFLIASSILIFGALFYHFNASDTSVYTQKTMNRHNDEQSDHDNSHE